MALSKQEVESLQTLLEQHCLHSRHIESERAWFMNVYGAVAAAMLTFSFTYLNTKPNPDEFPLSLVIVFSFLIALTFFGFLLTLRWIYAFECHRKRASIIIEVLLPVNGGEIPSGLGMEIGKIRVMPKNRKEEKHNWLDNIDYFFTSIFFGTKILFPLFYLVALTGITLFLCFLIPAATWSWKWILVMIPLIALLLGVRWYISLKDAK